MKRCLFLAVFFLVAVTVFAAPDDDDDDDDDYVRDCRIYGCRIASTCDDSNGLCVEDYPKCRLNCPKYQHCELETVICVRPPCPPRQVCVPGEDEPCDTVECREGYRCVDIDKSFLCVPVRK